MEERYLSLSEAADALDISERTAYRWINSGKLRAYKPGRDYRIPESAIREAVEESKVHPKGEGRSSLEPSLFNGLEDDRRAEATGRSEEERISISTSLSRAIQQMSAGYHGALEELSSAPVDEIFALYMQASLSYVGARTIAEDAGYSIDELDDSPPERSAKQQMRGALDKLDETTDEIERVMSAAEAEQELPEGVTLLARYERRHAV